ncbi:MAG TPA: alternative ribosome rescue aminoacyl-tRNA hydrolase ArfB [Terriglobia bacterium]|nr:alternative ribosome rescue aminoacyl-tRNA hydrolase ArfB [Terriglobia bacterium]
MIHVMDGVLIPENEIRITASRSGGPGGQNVNKVSSKVTLSFDVRGSAVLSEEQKRKIIGKLATRISKEGILQVVSQRTRSQELNRLDALARFSELLRRVLTPQMPRIKTRVSQAAKQRRVDEKRKHSLTKQKRSKQGWDT